jgi:hypothetical protein
MNPRPHPTIDPAAATSSDPGAVPGDVRDQIRRLQRDGGSYRAIAAAAGLAPTTVHGLRSGRRPPTPATERALSKVTTGTLRRARLDAGGCRLRLRALHVMGHGSARIARALGVREMTIRGIVRGDAPTVSARLRDAVTDLYDAWWDKRAPERTRFERSGHRCPPQGDRRQLCAGAGLDDDELDVPGYRPASGWKPATGTGTALRTSMPGVFAAGDIRHGSVKRVAGAVGEGSVTVGSIHQYLADIHS